MIEWPQGPDFMAVFTVGENINCKQENQHLKNNIS